MKHTNMKHTSMKYRFLIIAIAIAIMPSCSWFSTAQEDVAAGAAKAEVEAGAVGEGTVISITSKADFENYKKTKQFIVVDFHASWCPPCKRMKPINRALAKEYPGVTFLEIDIDTVKDVTAEYNVRGVPTFLFIKDGASMERKVGAMSQAAYAAKIQKHFEL